VTVDVSVIIMAYNEGQSVRSVLEELDAEMADCGYRYETIVVDDGSTDATRVEALAYAVGRGHVRVLSHPTNRGIGEVYRTGFAAARGTNISFLPADGQFPARIIRDFIPLMSAYDLVLGYLPDRRSSRVATAFSRIERLMYRVLFGPLPHFQGILMFRRGSLESLGVHVGGRGWQMLMDLVVRGRRAGYRIVSVPNELRPRVAGTSKVTNLRHVRANLRQAAMLRWRLWRQPVRKTGSPAPHHQTSAQDITCSITKGSSTPLW
jgi:glycosyltransferase involved in cell wall biosynthesis